MDNIGFILYDNIVFVGANTGDSVQKRFLYLCTAVIIVLALVIDATMVWEWVAHSSCSRNAFCSDLNGDVRSNGTSAFLVAILWTWVAPPLFVAHVVHSSRQEARSTHS